jgi:hypothetical protein
MSTVKKNNKKMDITGQLIKILPETTGQGAKGPWIKQEFVIETKEQYPKRACFSVWGDKVDILRKFSMSDMVKVSFNIESREHQTTGRWYTELRAWRIDRAGDEIGGHHAPPPAYSNSAPAPVSPQPTENPEGVTFSNEPANDLPF